MSTSQSIIPAETVNIQEKQVTVKVLTIGTKQVTQAFYKQLPIKSVRDEKTGLLRGKVWGWVNIHEKKRYGTGDCANDSSHLHVIWEDNGQLRRSPIYRDSDMRGSMYIPLEQAYEQSYLTCFEAGQLFIAVSGVWK